MMNLIDSLIAQDRRDALQASLSDLVEEYGLRMVLDALRDEAARQTMEETNVEAVKIFDVLRATKAFVDGDNDE